MYIGPKSRTERPREAKIGTEVAHVTRDSEWHHFQGQKVKGQGHQAALLTAALTRQAAAVGTYWPWEATATLLSAGAVVWRREALRRPQREERGGAYCGGSRTAYYYYLFIFKFLVPLVV